MLSVTDSVAQKFQPQFRQDLMKACSSSVIMLVLCARLCELLTKQEKQLTVQSKNLSH